ncbi:dioxygenase [Azospirillum sp. RWY-5-1]|uniref:Dioxygenase n=1 Tax=Azospirillum oleiclasticum TaxID=2735135 RepID=A0ABX2T8T6_9PROT|nr:class III extradiol ring-cleavage dioxygenase [Azospirillum oleiclasticum]NYZ12496.1 dioxygenase [Azospirillum oleiclasticum]NYZ19656.1 dioxygenase [Azospirillum oleiclasticum]
MDGSLPAVFVSHGSPMLVIEDGAAHRFLKGYSAQLRRPKAVLVVSAHWETPAPLVSTAVRPDTIHDFGGFARELYAMRYPAPGAPEVAGRAAGLLTTAGIPAGTDPGRGLDHGAWVPLMLLYPEADIPVTQLSIQPHLGPEHHWRVGQALRPLRDEGVLILATGAITHNLREFFGRRSDAGSPDWVTDFADWIADAVAEGRTDDLLDYRRLAPHAVRNHPTDEHLLPLFVALGAGSNGLSGVPVHRSHTYGVLAMDAYAFA